MAAERKIILVNNASKASGAEQFLLDLAESLQPHGYTPSFFVKADGVLEGRATSSGYPCHPVFSDRLVRIPGAIAAALRAEQPDIVLVGRDHSLYPIIAGYLLALPWLKKKPKLVAALQTPSGRRYPGTVNFLDGIVAGSDYVGRTFYRVNPGWEQKSATIYCGVKMPPIPDDKSDSDRPRRVLAGRKFPVIAMVGELWKNQAELVDVGALLQKTYPDITIAIVGGGDNTGLLSKIAGYGLERNFVLTGRIPVEQIPDLFYDLDLSVTTHRNEGLGIVNIASLAGKTPVVAYNSGGLVELIGKGGGVLVDGAAQEFAGAVIALLDDPERRRALGLEGRRLVEEEFSVEAMGQRYHAFFSGLFARCAT